MAPKGKAQARAKSGSAGPKAKAKASAGPAAGRASPGPAGRAKAKAAPDSSGDDDLLKERAEALIRECLAAPDVATTDGRVLDIAVLDGRVKGVDKELLAQAEQRLEEWHTFQEELQRRAEELRAQKAEAIAHADEDNVLFSAACEELQALKKRVEELFSAVEDSELDSVRSWVRECAAPPAAGDFSLPPLPVDVEDHEANTPLSEAACYGELDIVKFLLEQGANPDSQNKHGKTPLFRATYNGHEEVVRFLLESGANPKTDAGIGGEEVGKYGTPATKALIAGWSPEETQARQEGLSALQKLAKPWPRLLLEASRSGDAEAALLIAGAVPVERTELAGPAALLGTIVDFENMADALWNACTMGHAEVAKVLLEAKANANSFSETGLTCLMIACRKGHNSVVKLLLENGAKTYLRSGQERLALDYAREGGGSAESTLLDHCRKIKDWATLEEDAQQSEGHKVTNAEGLDGILESRRNVAASSSATAALRGMDASEIREGSDRYKQLLEERALADVLGLG